MHGGVLDLVFARQIEVPVLGDPRRQGHIEAGQVATPSTPQSLTRGGEAQSLVGGMRLLLRYDGLGHDTQPRTALSRLGDWSSHRAAPIRPS